MNRFLALVALGLAGVSVATAQVGWPEGSLAHYRIEVSRNLPANDPQPVCAVRFFSGGLLTAGAQNVRVTDPQGRPLPIQIVYTHPVNASLVLFPLQAGVTSYRLFLGGTVTPGAALTDFGRGLFYETRARPEGDSSTWEALRKMWAAATNSLGVAVLTDATTRCNPFDEVETHFLSRTFGAWRTPREDVYKLGVFAKDHGFLALNGQLVASTTVDPIADALLPAGVQHLEIFQARTTGEGVTGVSWLTPWPDYHGVNLSARPITPAWHPPVVASVVQNFELRGQPVSAYFNDFQTDMLLAAEQPVVLIQFQNRTSGRTAGLTYHWDFGDGTTSTEANPQHVYLKPGRYVVTLTAGEMARFSKLVLASSFSALPAQKIPMYESPNPWAAPEMVRLAMPALATYDAGALWTLLALAEKIEERKTRAEALLKIGPAYLAKAGTLLAQMEIPVREKLANARADLGQWDEAVAELRHMETKLEKQRSLRTKVQLQIGKLYQRAGQFAQALPVYAQIVAERGADDPVVERTAQIALGDTYLQQGEVGAARKSYESAGRSELNDGRTERDRAIRRGSLYTTLRQTITELSKLTLDTPGGWENDNREMLRPLVERAQTSFESLTFEFPDVRLNPDLLFLNATYRLIVGDVEACQSELRTLAKAEPSGRYTLRSMLLQARVNLRGKDYAKALALLEAVLKSTEDEPLLKEANALKKLATDAQQTHARFADATRQYWPNNLVPAAPVIEWSTPADTYKLTGSKGAFKIELLKPVTLPCNLTIRFPTAIGDRLYARCRIQCLEADFRWSEVRRSSTQVDSIHTRLSTPLISLQQWGWLESPVNVEPWRQFAWCTALATAGEPTGAMSFIALARPGQSSLPAGTFIYLDSPECYLAP